MGSAFSAAQFRARGVPVASSPDRILEVEVRGPVIFPFAPYGQLGDFFLCRGVAEGAIYRNYQDVSPPLFALLCPLESGLPAERLVDRLEAFELAWGDVVRASSHPYDPRRAWLHQGAPIFLAGEWPAILKDACPPVLPNLAIGTTWWILADKTTDLNRIVQQIAPDLPVFAANLDFSHLKHPGLLAYEQGVVKEGVGAGGAAVASLWGNPALSAEKLCQKVGESYQSQINTQRSETK